MYESPIAICMKQIRMTQDETIVRAVQDVGIFVDKDELIKALQYDRDQYEKGYADGLEAAKKQQWIPVEERVPGTERVLVTDGESVIKAARRPDGVWRMEQLICKPITHWMPLPEPPTNGVTERR